MVGGDDLEKLRWQITEIVDENQTKFWRKIKKNIVTEGVKIRNIFEKNKEIFEKKSREILRKSLKKFQGKVMENVKRNQRKFWERL